MRNPVIHVCPRCAVESIVAASGAQDLISLESPGVEPPAYRSVRRHLVLTMNDIVEDRPGLVSPSERHVAELVAFARRWDRELPLVIHCLAGISRSTAAAYVVAAALLPGREELEIAHVLRSMAPTATPNARIVAIADRLLDRQGRMMRAIEAIGRGSEAAMGYPFALDLGARPEAAANRTVRETLKK